MMFGWNLGGNVHSFVMMFGAIWVENPHAGNPVYSTSYVNQARLVPWLLVIGY